MSVTELGQLLEGSQWIIRDRVVKIGAAATPDVPDLDCQRRKFGHVRGLAGSGVRAGSGAGLAGGEVRRRPRRSSSGTPAGPFTTTLWRSSRASNTPSGTTSASGMPVL